MYLHLWLFNVASRGYNPEVMRSSRLPCLAGWLCLAVVAVGAADASLAKAPQARQPVPLWDGKETVAQYARRVNLPETQTLDLGNGVALELVLIPTGRFIIGTAKPKPVAEEAFHKKIIVGQAVLAVGGGILLFLLGGAILRADAEKHRFQYSLRRFMAMMFAASLCVLGGVHWWHSQDARAGYIAAMSRYADANPSEKPAHEVTVQKPFYLGKYVVTQEQYQQVTGANPSQFKGANLPVEMVSWDDAKEFCKRLSERLPLTLPSPHGGEGKWFVRLPTDAQWEYACRAGTVTKYYSGDDEADLARVAWYRANSGNSTHPVGQKEPNPWGLFDMHGNVCEWCEGWIEYHPNTYSQSAPNGEYRILRGGCWHWEAKGCRSASRARIRPGDRYSIIGFRVVLTEPP